MTSYAGQYISMDKISVLTKNNIHYILYEYTKYSNGTCLPRGMCGCDIDEGVIWIKKDRTEEKHDFVLRSCSLSQDVAEPPSQYDNYIKFSTISDVSGKTLYYIYNILQPERGVYDVTEKEYFNTPHNKKLNP